jgi:molybdopterin synthase catalytic subunit
MMVDLRDAPVSLDEAVAHVSHPGAGAVAVFVGTVREENDGHAVRLLEYQAYASMAVAELTRIAAEIEGAMPGVRVAALHRTGALRVGEIAVVCAASAPHRGESFAACRELIERIKSRVPIWKREEGPDGVSWVGWVDARCAADHDHASTGHDHR